MFWDRCILYAKYQSIAYLSKPYCGTASKWMQVNCLQQSWTQGVNICDDHFFQHSAHGSPTPSASFFNANWRLHLSSMLRNKQGTNETLTVRTSWDVERCFSLDSWFTHSPFSNYHDCENMLATPGLKWITKTWTSRIEEYGLCNSFKFKHKSPTISWRISGLNTSVTVACHNRILPKRFGLLCRVAYWISFVEAS